jgi:hypothetical protein
VAPVCTNCGSTDFVWAGELKTGGRLSAGQLSLRHGGELPLGTRICRSCGHADLFLRDTRILQAPHEWKPGEFVPIRTQPAAAPSTPAPPSPSSPQSPNLPPIPTPSLSAQPPPPPPPPESEPAPEPLGANAGTAPDASSPMSGSADSMPSADTASESTKPKPARRRSSKAKKAADEPEG